MASSNEEHLRLLEEQLKRLKPNSKAYQKVFAEHKRIQDELKLKSHYKAPFKARMRTGAAYGANKARQTFKGYSTANEHAMTAHAINQGIGYSTFLGGFAWSGHGLKKEAAIPWEKQVGKKSNRNRRNIRVGTAAGFGGLGIILGNGFAHGRTRSAARMAMGGGASSMQYFQKVAQPRKIHAIAFGTGAVTAGAGYALARKMHPNNSMTSKQWVTYKKQKSNGQIITVKRKNPYYGKKKKGGKR